MSASVHPRRRPAKAQSPSDTTSLIDCFQNMSIRKGETFNVPNTTEHTNAIWDPLENSKKTPSLPGRSTTCPKSLEDLLIGSGERRAAELLARVDKAIETQSKLALGAALNDPEVLPVPSFMVDRTHAEFGSRASRPRPHRHSHSSDSGIGSSVAGSADSPDFKDSPSDHTSQSAHSMSGISAATEQRGLSKYASEQIHKYIVKPILRENALKDFHPLIESVPERIGNKEIKNLRDLEKTLIFLAPDHSRTPTKYLQFCERTIRVLHTTVTTLHESDQKAPTDRPYTQGYFFDLVEQIRRYATILAATREKQAKGENIDEMDYTEGESVSLHGGMTHNGKPAELVRHTKDGKTISLATGQEVPADDIASASMKRPMLDVDNDDVARSMARRKKGAKPEIHECPLCDKEFKRPCDLTKHIKTHERPWKCPDEGCKYHLHGWPTEKERDRHVNDKHSVQPPVVKCLFEKEGCPYTSKRESNCKQHMEKAHGWEYVRSKSNGKGKQNGAIRLQRGSVSASPASALLTPLTPILPSPSINSLSSAASRHNSMAPPLGVAGPSNYGTPGFAQPSPGFEGHFNFNFNDMNSVWPTPDMSDVDYRTSSTSSHSGLQLDGAAFDDAYSPEQSLFDPNFDFNTFSLQQPSPPSADPNAIKGTSYDSGFASGGNMQASPGAQLDQTFSGDLYGNTMDFESNAQPTQDFELFGGGNSGSPANNYHTGDLMPSLPAEHVPGGGSWGDFGVGEQFSMPPVQTENSALNELFPDLYQ